jgi:ParB family transcriptional regulator, chromosome partitioning protein
MLSETRRSSGGLGRGLAALIPPPAPGVSSIRDVPVASVTPNPGQPRHDFDEEGLRQLAASIRAYGVLQPIVVTEAADGFSLVAGERRLRAARLAGLETVPAVVRDTNDQERVVLALVENIQRADLNAIEEARAYQHLVDAFGLTQEQVGERVGRSRPTIANALRILDTAPSVQDAIVSGDISGGHARALAGLASHAQQEALLLTIVKRALSVRQTEALVSTARAGAATKVVSRRRSIDPDIAHMESQVREALGTKVSITPGRAGGRITITWYDDEDLGRLVERLSAQDH